ncbi:hypothetical protein [Algoriphagus persicinus]|nr:MULTISPECIES: hypothetical protein [unclassified Algoriphagus]MEB2781278.1 hypothetical protein [Algoriphagus sp. C2-6-M1]MEB2784971.1 hypothetical protein [Algoriphagus sp. E1-3-M2]
MAPKKIIKPASTDEATTSSSDAVKNITELGKTELERKKRVDPGVE